MLSFPEAACSELMWEIDTQTLKFTNYSKGIDKILTFYQQLFVAKRFPYQVVINLEQIDILLSHMRKCLEHLLELLVMMSGLTFILMMVQFIVLFL